jgi:PAS domain S-box-containing protein
MATEMRKTGIGVVGDMPWGTHFCHFYETKEDLLDTLVPYFKAGLESQEFCLWVVSEPLTEEEARHALRQAVPDLDRYLADRSIEIVLASDWYLQGGTFDLKRVTSGWNEKLARALARGYAGMRVTGNTAWLEKNVWKDFCEYEDALNASITNQCLTVLCTYPLAGSGAAEILDVARTHQFAMAKRHGHWEVIETSELKQAKAEIQRLNVELEQRVVERTSQLTAVNEELRKEILERKRAEEALRRSEAYLAEAQRLTHTASWAWNVATREIVHWSQETYRLYGLDPKGGTPSFETVSQHIHPEDRARTAETFERAIRERADHKADFRTVLPDGTIKYIHLIGHPVFNASGDVVEFIGTTMDVTERKQAEEALHKAQADLAHVTRVMTMGELTASIAHEVNQPLAGVVTNGNACLRWLTRDPPNLEEVRECLRRIIRDGNRASDVIARLRALVKKSAPAKVRLDLSDMMHEVLAMINPEARRHRVTVRTDLAAGVPAVRGDRVQVQQVLLNLVMNGIDAMQAVTDRPREIRIRAQPDGSGAVLVAVQDTGIGLEPQSMARLFEAFYTTKADGMGMGLAISRSIVEAHGGRLWATPNDGHGATFQFTLPAGDERVS